MTWQWIEKRWLAMLFLTALSAGVPAAVWAGNAPPASPVGRNPVEITVHVPAGAQIWFDGRETAQTGTKRVFLSPPLEPGRDFAYEVRVQWRDGERMVNWTQSLTVRAGDRIGLTYTRQGFGEVRAYVSEATSVGPAPVVPYAPAYNRAAEVTPAIRYIPIYRRAPVEAPQAPRFYDPGPPAGPPGSNSPLSLGVGVG
jgi:uncharacterized protein (TIGR03000 family)